MRNIGNVRIIGEYPVVTKVKWSVNISMLDWSLQHSSKKKDPKPLAIHGITPYAVIEALE